MKVTTTHRDCDKVNKIVPIKQEHLGSVMNLARFKLLAFVLHALCVVQTVRLHKIASAMPMKATPMVAIVVHELPVRTDTRAQTAYVVTRKTVGLSNSMP